MKCFTVHSVCEDFFKLDLEGYLLTFDDALYSQYFYWEWINRINVDKILFVPTGAIIISDYVRKRFNSEFVTFKDCFQSLKDWKENGKRDNYMTLGELKYLINFYGVRIGGHSHNHLQLIEYGLPIVDRIRAMKEDVALMFEWFEKHLSYRPVDYCFPFNKDDIYLRQILESEGITKFYGEEREEIETLCKNQ